MYSTRRCPPRQNFQLDASGLLPWKYYYEMNGDGIFLLGTQPCRRRQETTKSPRDIGSGRDNLGAGADILQRFSNEILIRIWIPKILPCQGLVPSFQNALNGLSTMIRFTRTLLQQGLKHLIIRSVVLFKTRFSSG